MELLEEGNYKSDWTTKVECSGKGWQQDRKPCHSKYKIDDNDIFYRRHTDISGETDTYYGFICAKCGCFTELKTSSIPETVRTYARNYIEHKKH